MAARAPAQGRSCSLLLVDTRRAVSDFQRQITPQDLKAPLPHASPVALAARARSRSPPKCPEPSLLWRLWREAAARVARICAPGLTLQPTGKLARAAPAPRRWYRVHPMMDMTYFVRPDAGFRGRIPGYGPGASFGMEEEGAAPPPDVASGSAQQLPVGSRQKRRRRSLPPEVERRISLPADTGMADNLCRICFERPRGVVLLPCRHGGLCDQCLKRAIHMRPLHKGGRTCPFCRKFIREVIKIYDDAVYPQYGYAIKADAFTL